MGAYPGPPAGSAQRPPREPLEGLQPAQVGERLPAPVQGQQPRLLDRLGLQLPQGFGDDLAVPDDRQAEGIFRLVPGQPRGGIEDPPQGLAVRQVPVPGGDAPGDLFQLVPPGEVVFDDDEVVFQFDGICTTGERITK